VGAWQQLAGTSAPAVFVLETAEEDLEQRRPRSRSAQVLAHGRNGALSEVRISGPEPAWLPACIGPAVLHVTGVHHLELVLSDGPARPITEILTIRG
jgi:hypothetical protein